MALFCAYVLALFCAYVLALFCAYVLANVMWLLVTISEEWQPHCKLLLCVELCVKQYVTQGQHKL